MFLKSLRSALLWALFILIICGIPGQRIPHLDFLDWLRPDKIVHLIVFGILSYLLIKGFLKQDAIHFLRTNPRLSSLLISCVYGCVIEILQEYIFIHRSGDVRDAAADAIGALIGIWIFNYKAKKRLTNHSAS